MNLADFTRLVADMRHAQKEYFRTRSQQALADSKHLERVVDQALAAWDSGQRQLFPEADDARRR